MFGCFHFRVITSKAVINILIQVFLWIYIFSFLLDKYLGVELLDYRVGEYLTLQETAIFPK